jgi:hypothetical protein
VNLDEALDLLRRSEERIADNDLDPIFDNEPWYDGYVSSSPEVQARLRDAAESRVAAGDRRCWYASNLLRVGTIAIEPDRLSHLVRLYLDRRFEEGSKASTRPHNPRSRYRSRIRLTVIAVVGCPAAVSSAFAASRAARLWRAGS